MGSLFQRTTTMKNPLLLDISIVLQAFALIANHLSQMILGRSLVGPLLWAMGSGLLLLGIARMRRWAVVVQLFWFAVGLSLLGWVHALGKVDRVTFLWMSALPALRAFLVLPALLYWRRMTW